MPSLPPRLRAVLTAYVSFVFFGTPLCRGQGDESVAASIREQKGRQYCLTFVDYEKIPSFELDGEPSRIHSQGIYVTHDSLYVTGRLEKLPKKALLLRFDRSNLGQYEYRDVTPTLLTHAASEDRLDHPGGFDYDGQFFWIPIAVSRPHSSTRIVKVRTRLDEPLPNLSQEIAFVVDDHIGALAVDRKRDRLYGANWNSEVVYVWSLAGKLLNRIPREELLPGNPAWALAVQDWKSLSAGVVLAGGVDKDPQRDFSQPRALVQWINISRQRLVDSIRVPSPVLSAGSLTREGLAVFEGEVFFLPGDLNEDAALFRYQVESVAE